MQDDETDFNIMSKIDSIANCWFVPVLCPVVTGIYTESW